MASKASSKNASKSRSRSNSSSSGSLRQYHKKRDFRITAEPRGKSEPRRRKHARFVIQKHDASRLHYDFRLEVNGVLKSWAVPKGVPFKKGEKHLAVHVEDHPIEYGEFEGIIPKGQYGGGTVMLWDAGEFEPLGGDPAKDIQEGKLHFALHGTKLNGEWTLVRLARSENDEWLLIKSGADMKPISSRRDNQSSRTGRTMAQIATAKDDQWQSEPDKADNKLPFIAPMKATLVAEPPARGEWLYELKFDGYRVLALKDNRSVKLLSRNEKDFTARYSEIADAVAQLAVREAILDGEIVALDGKGRPSFQLLQALEIGSARPPLAFYIFDLLRLNGKKLTSHSLAERRKQLRKVLEDATEPIRFSATIEGDPRRLLEEIRRRGLEGLIGKESKSEYEPGRRSRSWIKLKCIREQEFVIGGYTPPEGARKHFGALLVGVYEGKTLRFAGKVGTGFNAAMLRTLHQRMKAIEQEKCPFADLPARTQGRWSQNITPGEMKRCRWVKPELVCQVRFTEWTDDGKLRHPAFTGLRLDKPAYQVTREKPAQQQP
jgi:bifunctional non-homologous end joining protein LigD